MTETWINENNIYGLIGTNNDYMKIYYKEQLIYYINMKPLGLDIFGNDLKEVSE